MTRYVLQIILFTLIVLSLGLTSFAQEPQTSAIPAADRQCDEDVIRSATAIALELAAARKLIIAQKDELKAAIELVETERERLNLMAEKNQGLSEQIEALQSALRAEQTAKAALDGQVATYKQWVEKLEKSRRATRRTLGAIIAGLAVGIFIGR